MATKYKKKQMKNLLFIQHGVVILYKICMNYGQKI